MVEAFDANWPSYSVGPRACTFALGVVAINYAHLEFALSAVFSTVLGINRDNTSLLFTKIRNPIRLSMIRERLPSREWPDEANNLVHHFIDGFAACARNRNVLVHSNISIEVDAIILYLSDNSGKTISCNPTLAEIRQVADEIKTFFDYGLAVANTINANLVPPKVFTSQLPWPNRPNPPRALTYTGGPKAIRGLYDDT